MIKTTSAVWIALRRAFAMFGPSSVETVVKFVPGKEIRRHDAPKGLAMGQAADMERPAPVRPVLCRTGLLVTVK